MFPGSWVHAAAAPPHQAFTSDPAGVVSDAVRFCPFATGNDILYAKACTSRRAMPSHDPATLVWRSDGCAVTGFDARAFVSLLQGRTLVFSGDSLMRQLFLGTLCALHAAGAVQPATVCAGIAARVGADGMLYYGPSAGAVATSSSMLAKSAMGRFGSDATLAKLRARGCARNASRGRADGDGEGGGLLGEEDVVLINAGVHLPVAQQAAVLHNAAHLMQEASLRRQPGSRAAVLYLQTTPSHFPRVAADGGYDPRVQDGFTRCLGRVSAGGSEAAQGFLATSRYLSNDEEIIRGAGLPMLSATPLLAVGAAHIGRHRKADNTTVGDCTHWCSPGPLEAYTLPMLQAYLARLKPHSSKERGARTRG